MGVSRVLAIRRAVILGMLIFEDIGLQNVLIVIKLRKSGAFIRRAWVVHFRHSDMATSHFLGTIYLTSQQLF